MRNTEKINWSICSETKYLIVGTVLTILSMHASYALGGFETLLGASMLTLPALMVIFVITPVAWQEFKKDMRGPRKHLRLWGIRTRCVLQRVVNQRHSRSLYRLRKKIWKGLFSQQPSTFSPTTGTLQQVSVFFAYKFLLNFFSSFN